MRAVAAGCAWVKNWKAADCIDQGKIPCKFSCDLSLNGKS